MAQPSYVPGGTGTQTNYSFVSSYDAVKEEYDPQLTIRYASERFTSLLDTFGLKKETQALEYNHFERDRIYPKIKATNGGAGAAGAAVTFTIDATAQVPYDQNPNPYSGAANTVNSFPVRDNQIVLVKPAAGSVSYGNYVAGITAAANPGAGTFTIQPLDAGDVIPSIATADEIIIIGDAHGEGSNQPGTLSYKSTKFTNQLQIFKDSHEITGTMDEVQLWFDHKGQRKFGIQGEEESWINFENRKELSLMFNPGLNNAAISNAFAAANTPISMNKGMAQSILDDGNEYNYSGISGFTMGDFDEVVCILDKQKGSKENMMLNGLKLNGQLDRELGDRFKNGGISYGNFAMDAKKHVDLGFSTVTVNGYSFHKKVLDAFNDLQSLGAAGYGFPHEGMIIPMDNTMDGNNKSVPSCRLRYLKGREMKTTLFDGFTQGDNGRDVKEVRYLSHCGIETFALNRFMYIKRA